MPTLHPYLGFDGTCEEAFRFYERKLGGRIGPMMTFVGTPMADAVGADWAKKILHGQIVIEGVTVMGSDVPPGRYEPAKGISLCLSLADVDRAEALFAALAEDGRVTMPLAQTFWAARFGTVTDKFGIPWMINSDTTA